MSDPLAAFFTQPATVERYDGDGATGPIFATPITVHGRIKHGEKLIRDVNGDEVVASASISLPASTPRIPVGSRVTVRGKVSTVIAEAQHIGGFAMSPDYYSIDLK